MHARLHADEAEDPATISTGKLPSTSLVHARLKEALERFADVREGDVATYIPALARAPKDTFAICLVGVDGTTCAAGDCFHEFSIQSIAKPFVFALILQELGAGAARRRIGVNSTGLPFDSVMAIELNTARTVNPMVNAGAIAATSLVPGMDWEAKWEFIRTGLSRFAGRALQLDDEVYRSESATNQRNQGVASLLESYGRLYADSAESTDLYTRQCAISVTVKDLAVMGATLADGGVNPLTHDRVVDADCCARVLAVLATAGMYEQSGDWLYEVGLPGKSGVSGGILTVAPGKCGLATFAPRLDDAGNSVKGQLATRFLSRQLGLSLFASTVAG
jgi:glutaminase